MPRSAWPKADCLPLTLRYKCTPTNILFNLSIVNQVVMANSLFERCLREIMALSCVHSSFVLMNTATTMISPGTSCGESRPYTLFQNGRHFSILLFTCKLALVASFKGKYCFEFRV